MTPSPDSTLPYRCVLRAWRAHQSELFYFLMNRASDRQRAEDVIQDVFLKALRAGDTFCALDDARAWLFHVARNALIDTWRRDKPWVELPEDLALEPEETQAPIDSLDVCLRRQIKNLTIEDQAIIQACDIQGQTVPQFAQMYGLNLSAAKARLRRARGRLRTHLITRCDIHFDERGAVCCHRLSDPPAPTQCTRC